jgi:hypothetical protein
VTKLAAFIAPTQAGYYGGHLVTGINEQKIDEIMDRAWSLGRVRRGAKEAVEWATDDNGVVFTFSDRIKSNDGIKLMSLGNDLDALIRWKQDKLRAQGRMSIASVERILNPDTMAHLVDPADADRLRSLVRGIRIPRTPIFIPQPSPEALRKSYLDAKPAVQKLLNAQAVEGTVIILPTKQLINSTHNYDLHYQCIGWTTKNGKDCGRVTGDMSHTKWTHSLNGRSKDEKDDIRRQAVEAYGPVVMPTIDQIVRNILSVADEHGWDNITMYKKDVAQAFTQLFFDEESVALTAFALDADYSLVHLAGNFGAVITVFGWEVVGRVMDGSTKARVASPVDRYVDDFLGACHTRDLAHVNKTIDNIISDLLGPGALAPHKDESGRALVILGWQFDLESR